MNEIKQPAQTQENSASRGAFWGTIVLDVIALLIFGYFLAFFMRQNRTPLIYIATAVFLYSFSAALVSLVLTIRGRQKLAAEISFYTLYVMGLATISIFQGRQSAIFAILVMAVLAILYLLPSQSRRWYWLVTVVGTLLMLAIDRLNPSWRLELNAARPGPAAAVVFAVILVTIAALQAWKGNIRLKLVTAFTIIALFSVAILGTVTYINFRNQVRDDIRQRLLNVISITALQQNGDLFATIQSPADMQGAAYQKMQATNASILGTDRNLAYIYAFHLDEQGQLIFVLDNGLQEGYDPVDVGVVYDDASDLLKQNARTLDHPIVEQDFYTDKYGTFLSAYAPIYGSDGTRQGIVGVDIFADNVLAKERTVLFLILGTTLATMFIVTLLGLWLGNVFVHPIINLSRVTHKITEGDLSARAEIETADEVGDLAKAFNTMTSQLQGTLQGLEQRVADRTRNLELAAEVGRAVSQVRALDVMLKDACELILKEFNLYYVQVYLADASGSTLKLEAGTGSVGAQLVGRGHSLPLNSSSINGRAAVEKHPVVIADTSKSATFRNNPLLPETQGEMAVPLILANKVVGVLDMQSNKPGVLTEEILPAFEALAGQLAVAIQNSNLLAEAEQARAQMEAQARRLVRQGWNEHLDAIHKPEQIGFVFDQNKVAPLADASLASENGNVISAPIAVTGESLGSLVVELDDEARREQTRELVNVVARQVAQQIENLRLLESAERYRYEAERAARIQTLEGWQEYIKSRTTESLGYLYDLNEVRAYTDEQDEVDALTLPVRARDEKVGKLSVQGLTPEDTEAVELANVIAERLGAHIESLRLFEETRRGQVELDKRARQLAAVAEISTVSSKELDVQKMLESVVLLTQRKFGLYHAHVFLFDEATQILGIVACGWKEGDPHEGTHGTARIPLNQEQSLVARAARTRQPVIVNDVHNEPGWLPNPLLPDTMSELAVPLIIGDQILGVLDVQSDRLNAFTEEDANIQTTLASQVATAMQNARSFTQAQKQAEREAMLNVINQKIQSATSVEAVLQIAARELGHALGAPMTVAQLSMKDKSS